MTPFKGILASSVDPSELSLTIESGSKVIIGLLVWFAVSRGMNPLQAQTQLQAIIDLIAQAVPMVFALWHTMHTIWGLVRKLYAQFRQPAAPAQQ